MAISDHPDFRALDPFFEIVEQGVSGLVPKRIQGRQAVAELYRPYGESLILNRCHDLAVHHDTTAGVVVLEYTS